MERTAVHRPARIVILGANGQIGKAVFFAVKKRFPEAELLGCVRSAHLHFEGVAGDHHQRSVIFDALHDDWKTLGTPDVIINCIGAIDERTQPFEAVHVLPLLRLTDAFETLGRPKLIQVSALGATPESPSAFLRTKAFAEKLALRLPRAVVVRPSIVCTPGTMLVKQLRKMKRASKWLGGKMFVPENFLRTQLQPVDERDLTELICLLVEEEPAQRSIDAAGAERFSIRELIEMTGVKPVAVPQRLADRVWKMLRPFLRRLISDEQYRLLGTDNVAELKTPARSTGVFWKKELVVSGVNTRHHVGFEEVG